ncbi:MAG TPA: kelch repeat-containing protein [Candidatus Eisenbacteria bacterium]|nr:kelch repeat-containing protein [Candidatus Eisenbacteria bacterium]
MTPLPGGAWAGIVTTGESPAAREDHTLTVDEAGATAYLFGGRDGATVFGDLWALDLASDTWQLRSPAGDAPLPRFGHEGVWIPGRGLVIFAGQAGSAFFNDLWLYDPAADRWSLLPAAGSVPVPRYGTCAALGPDGRLWMSHGFTEDGIRFADSHAYDFAAGMWSDEAPAGNGPIERCLQTCWWRSDGTFALYGGQTTGVAALGDLWTLTPGGGGGPTNTWSEVGGDLPPARNLPAVARHAQATIILGGRGIEKTALADAWQLPDATGTFSPLPVSGEVPPPRWGASLIDDPIRDRLVLFGGTADGGALGDLWALNTH